MTTKYTVTGRWPFPTDMLRYDDAEPATAEAKELIEKLSDDSAASVELLRGKFSVELISKNSRFGLMFQSQKRWASFGWTSSLDEASPERASSPIKSGWRGNLSGHIEKTRSQVKVSEIELLLDPKTAYALCNLLHDGQLKDNHSIEDDQREALSQLGAALGRLIDHGSANNGDRVILK